MDPVNVYENANRAVEKCGNMQDLSGALNMNAILRDGSTELT